VPRAAHTAGSPLPATVTQKKEKEKSAIYYTLSKRIMSR